MIEVNEMSRESIVLDLEAFRHRNELYTATFLLEAPHACFEFDPKLTAEENLQALARAALYDRYSLRYLFVYQQIILEVISRWIGVLGKEEVVTVLDATARYTTCYPMARPFVEQYLERQNEHFITMVQNAPSQDAEQLRMILLAYYRLLFHNKDVFAKFIRPEVLYKLINQEKNDRVIKYLAVKILSIYLDSGEAAENDMIRTHLSAPDAIWGPYEGNDRVDYRFLELNEAKIASCFSELPLMDENSTVSSDRFVLWPQDFSERVVSICGVLVPRVTSVPDKEPYEVSYVPTEKAVSTLRQLAKSMQNSEPMMLIGKAGSGKTFLINELTKYLRCHDSVVKIHLGEQTDAKLLIGTYTSGEKPGTFVWRSGVLTTAVKEGRCVLIEDVDKAPTDVLSILLTLLERRELSVPSRGETIKAANGFQIISTVRTKDDVVNHQKNATSHINLLGMRLWNIVAMEEPDDNDLRDILTQKFPLLLLLIPRLIQAYNAVRAIYLDPRFTSLNKGAHTRIVSVRDLVKLCHRLQVLLANNNVTEPDQLIESQIYDDIFAEATDCFAGAISESKALEPLMSCVGECLEVSNARIALYLKDHVPAFESHQSYIQVGRSMLKKSELVLQKKTINSTSFASTNHSLRLMEQIGVAVQMCEPVLLVGETGTGKTTVVQQLSKLLHKSLTVINVSQQTETGDLLGGYKPVNSKTIALPIQESFESLFGATFSLKKNEHFYKMLHKCFNRNQWRNVVRLWVEACKMAHSILEIKEESEGDSTNKKKKRRLEKHEKKLLSDKWTEFEELVRKFEAQSSSIEGSFVFDFVEGSLVRAVRNGEWLLLDEVNLASADTLESISDLLAEKDSRSILLSEKGDAEPVRAHPDFRIFACMNPATDVGKRDLPSGIRSRFTEIYVHSPDRDISDLLTIIDKYIHRYSVSDEWVGNDIAELYLKAKKLAEDHQIVDGSNEKPHFSIRTLTRTLLYVCDIVHIYGLRRSLYDGFCMSFLTLLSQKSEALLEPIIRKFTLGRLKNLKSVISQAPQSPGPDFVQFKHYWMKKGHEEITEQTHYIITPFVEKNLMNLVRATSSKRFPVLVQGPTSAGKTSMIKYLADITGHKFVRINNHEHTDLQEYLGTYVADDTGKLAFKEGVLVEALRNGYWIVLDELNLAPTDVLEALNRLLDDNRELFIPETQETIHPHPDFMLFATQNPPGIYGGRKILSRAFRNRFLELHFDDIPQDELEIILRERCQIAPPYAKKIVEAYRQLSIERSSSRLFEQKNSFATLRDLFRWAFRDAVGYEQLASNGYMLLAERCRTLQEKEVVQRTLEKVMKVKLDMDVYYKDLEDNSLLTQETSVVWTKALRRLSVLVSTCLKNNEPVLLVGETGCGKTTICQLLASFRNKQLITLNAHQNTETGDLLGAQRPVRNRSAIQARLTDELRGLLGISSGSKKEGSLDEMLVAFDKMDKANVDERLLSSIKELRENLKTLFEWCDGPLIHALKDGDFFLLDEISLADDSVLERLNSVLEPERSLLLAEKGASDCLVSATDGFQFFATMNPGGDYGKKELSPALRNRFTEIWVSSMEDFDDVGLIVSSKLETSLRHLGKVIVAFAEWFAIKFGGGNASSGVISLRDILAWVEFMNSSSSMTSSPEAGLSHGAAMVFIDALGTNNTAYLAESEDVLRGLKAECICQLSKLAGEDLSPYFEESTSINVTEDALAIGPFKLPRRRAESTAGSFNWDAPTTSMNFLRVARALQVDKPILLEGSPGVGKTSLVTVLAEVTGNNLTRINLSEQTDLIDLFGSDVPGENSGEFVWRDAPFLRAMQLGEWVLLDEMNLASQSVLEGLNACLDHRGEAYIPELDKNFARHPNFTVFAAQNPQYQGGGRKGLPKSFVNRFSVVYINTLSSNDLMLIANNLFPSIQTETAAKMIQLMSTLEDQVSKKKLWGTQGAPWEFNLRDTLRWMKLICEESLLEHAQVTDFFDIIVRQRFRNHDDREKAQSLIENIFGAYERRENFYKIDINYLQVNAEVIKRSGTYHFATTKNLFPLQCNFEMYESALRCVKNRWPVILVGPSNSGKTDLVMFLAATVGAEVAMFSMNSDVDSMDILGGYEQVDLTRKISHITDDLRKLLRESLTVNLGYDGQNRDALVAGFQLMRLVSKVAVNSENFTEFKDCFNNFYSLIEKKDEIEDIAQKIERMSALILEAASVKFEWFDGILVRAVEKGHWLILDNANLCSPSVLDRLNSLLETDGSLVINECSQADGQPKQVFPHPNFRLFLTVNPKYGELSRAMRNRGVEIFMEDLRDRATTFDRKALAYDSPHATESRFKLDKGMHDLSLRDMRPALPLKRFVPSHLSSATTFAQILDVVRLSSTDILENPLLGMIPFDRLDDLDAWCENVVANRFFSDGVIAEKLCAYRNFLVNLNVEERLSAHLSPVGEKLSHLLHQKLVAKPQTFLPALNVYELSIVDKDLPKNFKSESVYLLAALELLLECCSNLQYTTAKSKGGKLNDLSYIEMSAALENGRKLKNAPRIPIYRVLAGTIEFLSQQVSEGLLFHNSDLYHFVWNLLIIWVGAFDTSSKKDEARLAVYKDLFKQCIESAGHEKSLEALSDVFSSFNSSLELTRGQSMNLLWSNFRVNFPSSSEAWNYWDDLLRCSKRFDEVAKCQFPESYEEVDSLRSVLNTLFEDILRNGATDFRLLSSNLNSGIQNLEDISAKFLIKRQHLFLSGFDHIARCLLAEEEVNADAINQIAPFTSLSTEQIFKVQTKAYSFPPLFDFLWVKKDGAYESFSSRMFSSFFFSDTLFKSNNMKNFAGSLMRQTLSDAKLLLSSIVKHSKAVLNDPAVLSAEKLRLWLKSIIEFHAGTNLNNLDVNETAKIVQTGEEEFQIVFESHLLPVIQLLDGRLSNEKLGKAWVYFGMALIILYAPDHPSDPAIRDYVIYDNFLKHKRFSEQLKNAWASVRQVQSGDVPLSIEKIVGCRSEIEPPKKPRVYRPTSAIDELFAEWTSLYNSTLNMENSEDLLRSISLWDGMSANRLNMFQQNTSQFLDRMKTGYQYYSDLNEIFAGYIYCMKFGFDLLGYERIQTLTDIKIEPLWAIDPLTIISSSKVEVSFREMNKICRKSNTDVVNVEKMLIYYMHLSRLHRLDEDIIFTWNGALQALYYRWSLRERKAESKQQEQASLFRYQDDADNYEEDFKQMFPDYEEVMSMSSTEGKNTGELDEIYFLVAKAYMAAFDDDEVKNLESVLHEGSNIAQLLSEMEISAKEQGLQSAHLTSILNRLASEVQLYEKPSDHVDFYNGFSISESQRSMVLVDDLWKSVSTLLAQWPEHATLRELSRICEEFLAYSINTPMARLLQKFEQIYTFTAEWEKFASSQVSLQGHIKRMTDLIVSWRRLELRTWSSLLKTEDAKLESSIGKWWFHLFETIIVPLNSPELEDTKLTTLLVSLSVYLSKSCMGEFVPRLELLRAFAKHINVLKFSESGIARAVNNIIAFYSQFEPLIISNIVAGRKQLEKEIKDVILLASWKDVNVEALKQSSRRSHNSLYKLVRKYRRIISESVQSVIESGVPLSQKVVVDVPLLQAPKAEVFGLMEAKQVVVEIPNWETRPSPLKNIDVVLSNMNNYLKQIDDMELPNFALVAKDMASEAERLEKETPKVYSKEKKKLLASLKMQKTKLLSDCLKELKRLGLKNSLREDIHNVQSSVSAILTNMASFSDTLVEGCDSHFLRILDLLPSLRNAVAEPSDSIPSSYVERGMANMENLIFSLLTLRDPIRSLAASHKRFSALRLDLEAVAASQTDLQFQSSKFNYDELKKICKWLPILIDHALLTMESTSSFGNTSSDVAFLTNVKTEIFRFKQDATNSTGFDISCQSTCKQFQAFLGKLLIDFKTRGSDTTLFIYHMLTSWLEDNAYSAVKIECEQGILEEPEKAFRRLFASTLLSFQKIMDSGVESITEEEDKWLSSSAKRVVSNIRLLRHPTIVTNMEAVVKLLQEKDYVAHNSFMMRALVTFTLPVLRSYESAMTAILQKSRAFYTDMAHGSYILSVLLRNLAQNGFCSPEPPSEETEDNNLHEGTGLGDGEGAQNNSQDVEQDEDLTENAQSDNKERDDEKQEDQEDDAVVMEGDMAGDLENLSDQDDKEEETDEQEDDEMDEEVDDLNDDDPNAIDEKMWDEKPDSDAKEKNTESNLESKDDDADVQAAEGESQNADNGEDERKEDNAQKDEAKKEEKDAPDDDDNMRDESDGEADEGEQNEGEEDVGEQEDEIRDEDGKDLGPEVPETETLDLPEDMNLDSGEDKDEQEENDQSMSDSDDPEEQAQDEGLSDNNGLDEDAHEPSDVEMEDSQDLEQQQIDSEMNENGTPSDTEDHSDAPEEQGEFSDEEELQNDQKVDQESGQGAVEEGLDGLNEPEESQSNDAEAAAQQQSGSKGVGSDSRDTEESKDMGSSGDTQNAKQEDEINEMDRNESSRNEAKEALKQLGDSLKEYHKRRQEINEATEAEDDEKAHDAANQRPDEFEHLDGANTESDTQALGHANQDQIQSINDEKAIEDDASDMEDPADSDVEMNLDEGGAGDDNADHAPLEEIKENEEPQQEKNTRGAFIGERNLNPESATTLTDALKGNEDDELEELMEEIDTETLQEQSTPPRSVEDSRLLWRDSEIATAELSARLSEQLRLILEPTLATKLRGDYKTGKRLNMKRIIPYIASQFKKDKIWLRRTKPSKRQYQIMVALDDSKSMSESKCVKLAFDSLCLVSKTLTQLESGGLSIVKFGETIKEVHSFDQQFSNDAGAKSFQWFGFQETKTDIKKLVAESIKIFERARPLNSGDQWQLEIVISDGLCENHETVQRLVRRARENRIMLVFVIIDGINNNESIMDMSQVKYVPDQMGNMQLKIDRYLDTFPFEFYVVVHDISELPEMLSTILRQFFTDLASS